MICCFKTSAPKSMTANSYRLCMYGNGRVTWSVSGMKPHRSVFINPDMSRSSGPTGILQKRATALVTHSPRLLLDDGLLVEMYNLVQGQIVLILTVHDGTRIILIITFISPASHRLILSSREERYDDDDDDDHCWICIRNAKNGKRRLARIEK